MGDDRLKPICRLAAISFLLVFAPQAARPVSILFSDTGQFGGSGPTTPTEIKVYLFAETGEPFQDLLCISKLGSSECPLVLDVPLSSSESGKTFHINATNNPEFAQLELTLNSPTGWGLGSYAFPAGGLSIRNKASLLASLDSIDYTFNFVSIVDGSFSINRTVTIYGTPIPEPSSGILLLLSLLSILTVRAISSIESRN